VLVVSFVALGALWTKPLLGTLPEKDLPSRAQRILLSPVLHVVVQALSFGLLVVIFLAALIGEDSAAQNLAPTFIYVVFWLGLVAVSVLFGNVWRVLNPWRAAADFAAWAWRSGWTPPFRYPERLGRWPAAVLLFAFAALELAYSDPSSTHALALAIGIYSWLTWVGALAFGRDAWFANAEAFTSYFGLYSRLAPFGVRDGRVVRRVPLHGLAESIRRPGTVASVAVMLGTVLFDGFSRTTWFLNRQLDVEEPFALDNPGLADLARTGLSLAGLVVAVLLVAVLFLGAVDAARRISGYRGSLANEFVGSLIPIAVAYVVAPLLLALRAPGPARDPARVGSIRLRLGPLRHEDVPGDRGARTEHGLVRAGRRAHRRPRPRADGRARPRGRAVPGEVGDAGAVRDARADGAVHGRWHVGALVGLVVELTITAIVVAIAFAAWGHSRRGL
jgi:hypothetical protein